MKRAFSSSGTIGKNLLKGILVSFLTISLFVILLMILSLIQLKFQFEDHVLKIILLLIFSFSAGFCSYVLRRFISVKGYVCGLTVATFFGVVKLFLSLASGGVGKSNVMIYVLLFAICVLFGILSANHKRKVT